jgi:hypothetical protein
MCKHHQVLLTICILRPEARKAFSRITTVLAFVLLSIIMKRQLSFSTVTFADLALVHVVTPVPSLVNSREEIWYSPSDYEDRKYVDTILIKGVLMGTIPPEVCLRGLESRLASIIGSTNPKSPYRKCPYAAAASAAATPSRMTPTTKRSNSVTSAVDAVLETQERQRQRKLYNAHFQEQQHVEEIADACRRRSEGCRLAALERGRSDQSVVFGDDGSTEETSTLGGPSSSPACRGSASSLSAMNGNGCSTSADCMSSNEDQAATHRTPSDDIRTSDDISSDDARGRTSATKSPKRKAFRKLLSPWASKA